jgi:hypothetical protein
MGGRGAGATLPDEVRAACAAVAEEATFVRIDAARIPAYAATLAGAGREVPVFDSRYHFVGDEADTVAFVLTLDAINFGSGYFPLLRKRPGLPGYFTVSLALKERFDAHGPFGAAALRDLTADDCRALLDQPTDGGALDELMAHFAAALNALGAFLLERYAGRPEQLVAAAGGSAARLTAFLAAMPTFRDVSAYRGRRVPFYKRAQLVAADLSLALGGTGLGAFDDLDRLTIFADNLVPHVLRVDGILRYDAGLLARIAAGELLAAGSPEEIEIRAAAVHAAELLVAACRARGAPRTARDLDYVLWNRGLAPLYREQPRHRTRTTAY